MLEQDIPLLDKDIEKLPSDLRQDLATMGLNDLYFFGKGILGFRDMVAHCHMPFTIFLQDNPGQFKLAMMPRDHLKTHAGTIAGSMQKATRDPNERILLVNEAATNAQRFLGAIKQHAEMNRVYRALYSHVIPKNTRNVKWNEEELVFNRTWLGPEPTFDTIGMTGSMTSRHYTHICIDDPISKEAIQSEKVMADAIVRLKDMTTLLVDPSKHTIWFIGTRWALFDVYSWVIQKLGSHLVKFARGAIEDGLPIWPERFSLDTLALKRSTMGEYLFSCLMMNNPRNTEIQDLNVDDLKFWQWKAGEEDVIELLDKNGVVEEEWPLHRLDVTTTVDLAPAETVSSDRNAVVTVGLTPTARAVVLEAWGKRCTPLELIDKLFEVKRQWHPRVFGIEGVAYQKALKYFVKDYAEREGLYLSVVDIKVPPVSKPIRIRGLQPVMATGRLYAPPVAHILRNEMADFPLGEHDDVVDCLASQLQLWRGQMSPERWERLKKEEAKMIRAVMDKERYLTDSPQSAAAFDTDDHNQDDLPGPNYEKYLKVS